MCACAFTKPPLLQESRLTGGGSPNLVVFVEWKVPVERFMGAANTNNLIILIILKINGHYLPNSVH